MKLTSKKISLIIGLTAASLFGLLLIQVYWLRDGVELDRRQFAHKMDAINERIVEDLRADNLLMEKVRQVAQIEDEYWLFGRNSEYPELEGEIESRIAHTLYMSGIKGDYDLRGRIAARGSCWYYQSVPHNHTPGAALHNSNNKLCFCTFPDIPVFDLGYTFAEIPVISTPQLTGLSIASFLFILILIVSFGWFVFTIYRQKRLSALKTDFINNLTHEFKTPIFSIGLGARMIRQADAVQGEEKLMSYVDLIERENLRLKNQVDKVLQIAVMDSGNFALDPELIHLNPLIMRVAKSFQTIVHEKGGRLRLDLQAQKQILFADKTHISNILYNLLDNACKYSPESPDIFIQTVDRKNGLEIRISDNGIGMSSHVQALVFDKFYRAESGNLHDVKGFGLGLSYVKNIVEMHKGRIHLQSKAGQGSTFTIYLPNS